MNRERERVLWRERTHSRKLRRKLGLSEARRERVDSASWSRKGGMNEKWRKWESESVA